MKKKSRFDILNFLKYGMVVALLIYIIWLLNQQGSTNVSMATMKKNILKVADTSEMKKATTQDLKKYYGLNAGDYQDAVLYIPNNAMGVNELLIIKLTDIGQAQQVEMAAQMRLDTQKTSFEGYGAKQTKLINGAIVETRGDYVLLVIHKGADAVQNAFRKSL